MSSLAYRNEHQAWKQRVNAEVSNHTQNISPHMSKSTRNSFAPGSEIPGNPNTIRDAFFEPIETYATIVRPQTPETETHLLARKRSSLVRIHDRPAMRLKEVRGKYARQTVTEQMELQNRPSSALSHMSNTTSRSGMSKTPSVRSFSNMLKPDVSNPPRSVTPSSQLRRQRGKPLKLERRVIKDRVTKFEENPRSKSASRSQYTSSTMKSKIKCLEKQLTLEKLKRARAERAVKKLTY